MSGAFDERNARFTGDFVLTADQTLIEAATG